MPTKPRPPKVLGTSAHAIADWGMRTGRLGLSERAAWIEAYSENPGEVLGRLLLADPSRTELIPVGCPLFETNRGVVIRQQRGAETRARHQAALVDAMSKTVKAALEGAGVDPCDQKALDGAHQALRELAKREADARRRELAEHKRVKTDRSTFGALADRFGPVDEELTISTELEVWTDTQSLPRLEAEDEF